MERRILRLESKERAFPVVMEASTRALAMPAIGMATIPILGRRTTAVPINTAADMGATHARTDVNPRALSRTMEFLFHT